MSETLKPCPFCGGEAIMYLLRRFDVYEIDYYYVFCNDCKTSFSNEYVEETESSTREWWNARADEGTQRYAKVHKGTRRHRELSRAYYRKEGVMPNRCSSVFDIYSEDRGKLENLAQFLLGRDKSKNENNCWVILMELEGKDAADREEARSWFEDCDIVDTNLLRVYTECAWATQLGWLEVFRHFGLTDVAWLGEGLGCDFYCTNDLEHFQDDAWMVEQQGGRG